MIFDTYNHTHIQFYKSSIYCSIRIVPRFYVSLHISGSWWPAGLLNLTRLTLLCYPRPLFFNRGFIVGPLNQNSDKWKVEKFRHNLFLELIFVSEGFKSFPKILLNFVTYVIILLNFINRTTLISILLNNVKASRTIIRAAWWKAGYRSSSVCKFPKKLLSFLKQKSRIEPK